MKNNTLKPNGAGKRYFLIAGEASGDLHGARLMREIKALDSAAEFCFLGGDLMQAQGGKLVKHYREMAFMGFFHVLKNAGKVAANFEECKRAIRDFQPDVLILIDYPSFNLRIAKYVKKTFQIPVYYYIAPKIWAWKEFRIKQIKRYVDRMFTIFPFETEFYKKHHYEVSYVGNPTVDSIAESATAQPDFAAFVQKNNLSERPIIAVLPGSRRQEIAGCLPTVLAAVSAFPDMQVVVSGAPGIDVEFYDQFRTDNGFQIVFGQTYDLLANAEAAVVNSGTATLETALIGTPQVVVYRVAFGRVALLLKSIFIQVKYISLVNLIADKEVVRELIAHYFTVENVRKEVDKLLHNVDYQDKMKEGYETIRNTLGGAGAAKRAAKEMVAGLA